MALYTELPIYRDTYQLILRIFEITKEFSKEYKYTLGQDMKRDALSLMINTHEQLWGRGCWHRLRQIGYDSLSNEQLLIEKGVLEIQLPRPDRTLNAARETTPWTIRQLLHHRRAGIRAFDWPHETGRPIEVEAA